MQIRPQEIDYKKNIGNLDGRPVWEIGLKGGYHLICAPNGPRVEYLGAGPHRAVARFIAKKKAPGLRITELSKSDHIESEHFTHLVPQYETLTDMLNVVAPK